MFKSEHECTRKIPPKRPTVEITEKNKTEGKKSRKKD